MKKVIILIGPPGAGKGTQANLLSERLGLYNLETSKVGEQRIARAKKGECIIVNGKKYSFDEEKKKWQTGELWDSLFVLYLIKEKVQELFERKEGIVFQGSPRTIEEAKGLMPFLEKFYGKKNIQIFLLKQSAEESIWRNSHRRICELMRHPILHLEETKDLKHCPLDGSRLIKRALDKPEIIKERYKIYQKQTLPMIEYCQKRGLKIQKINAEQPVADVFSDILKFLK